MDEKTRKEFEELYSELFEAINDIKNSNGKRRNTKEIGLSYTRFTAMHGNRYWKDENGKENAIRFMLVGRAVNGWGEYSGEDESKQSFIKSSIDNFLNEKCSLSKSNDDAKDRFEWIVTPENDSPHNTFREGIDKEEEREERGTYKLTGSPFWSYTKNIWDILNGGRDSLWNERWFEKIAWTNLYKIAPTGFTEKDGKRITWGANPNTTECKKQLEVCKKLLGAEIEFFKPTHILFVTDKAGWYDDFGDHLEKSFYAKNIKEIDNEFVKKTMEYIIGNTVCKVVVVCRPETRPKENYVKIVSECFL